MTRASALDAAARSDPALGTTTPGEHGINEDRRLTDSNRAWLGKVVDGRYCVLEVIGRGGMGVVYRVEHLRMGKIAAMKVLHRDLADDKYRPAPILAEMIAAGHVGRKSGRGFYVYEPTHKQGPPQ